MEDESVFDAIDRKVGKGWALARQKMASIGSRCTGLAERIFLKLGFEGLKGMGAALPLRGSRLVVATYAGASVMLKFLPVWLINARNSALLEDLERERPRIWESLATLRPPLSRRLWQGLSMIRLLAWYCPKAAMYLLPGSEIFLLYDWRSQNHILHWVPLGKSVWVGHGLPTDSRQKIRELYANAPGLYLPGCKSPEQWKAMIENLYSAENKFGDLNWAICP